LWIDDPSLLQDLPNSLKNLQRRGLEIYLCENFGPHTKYFPYVSSIKDHVYPLVTGDDDQLYPTWWLEELLKAYEAAPDRVNCHYAKVVGLVNGELQPYEGWAKCDSTNPSYRYIALGVSGVIYPPGLLNALRNAGTAFRACCPKADDVWLHVQALRNGYRIQQLTRLPREFLMIPGSQDVALWHYNLREGGNNWQIRATYTSDDYARMSSEGRVS
jgi:hypothetical protein